MAGTNINSELIVKESEESREKALGELKIKDPTDKKALANLLGKANESSEQLHRSTISRNSPKDNKTPSI